MLFHDPGELADGDLRLILASTVDGDSSETHAPHYRFAMRHAINGETVGRISLRLSNTDFFRLYAGHIGFFVNPEHRGNRFAARASRLLIPLARRHMLGELWITCNPENAASRRSCELAGAEYIETVDLPSWTSMYQRGERQKCRYLLTLT